MSTPFKVQTSIWEILGMRFHPLKCFGTSGTDQTALAVLNGLQKSGKIGKQRFYRIWVPLPR